MSMPDGNRELPMEVVRFWFDDLTDHLFFDHAEARHGSQGGCLLVSGSWRDWSVTNDQQPFTAVIPFANWKAVWVAMPGQDAARVETVRRDIVEALEEIATTREVFISTYGGISDHETYGGLSIDLVAGQTEHLQLMFTFPKSKGYVLTIDPLHLFTVTDEQLEAGHVIPVIGMTDLDGLDLGALCEAQGGALTIEFGIGNELCFTLPFPNPYPMQSAAEVNMASTDIWSAIWILTQHYKVPLQVSARQIMQAAFRFSFGDC